MEELNIIFDKESPQEKNSSIRIKAFIENNKKILYKFIIGKEGTWNTVNDFGFDDTINWIPEEEGEYIIMVQAKREDSTKPFDFISKFDYVIGEAEENFIRNVYLNKDTLNMGERIEAVVESNKFPLMFKYWLKEDDNWKLIKDYSTENSISLVVKKPGIQELMVECKDLKSVKDYDDSFKVAFKVNSIDNVEIVDFNCLTKELICDEDLVFKVESVYEEGRDVLYKFIKIDSNGTQQCIQDYSSNNVVSYIEKDSGDYKLLCLVKDMYSQNEFDDRAMLKFTVKAYRDIVIRKFTTNLNSPQMTDTAIELKINAEGGKELLYKFIIKGKHMEDSGYIRNNIYTWTPSIPGKYSIEAWVKDSSSENEFDDKSSIEYTINLEYIKEPIKIEKVILDKGKHVLKGEEVEIRAISNGGNNVRYAFSIKKDGKEEEKIDFGTCNWAKFIPKETGTYELEVLAKHKYSSREYDSHYIAYINSHNYIPAIIDYVICPVKTSYIVGDEILLKVIIQNTKDNLIKYILRINNEKVEETDYIENKDFKYIPKCSGAYTIEVLAKNKESEEIYDSKKEVKFYVREALPITNTKIKTSRTDIKCNETVTFSVDSEGGNAVLYQFYIMNKGEWKLVQDYSRKKYYTFMPFNEGEYEVLVLSKSSFLKCAYEDYDIFKFKV
ncbi:triple tyrosine motif-containing protein [Clostridium botulinum]|uniref:triple tyrosine motif-containing protein n=1 Tax=Clostridium botulinum TaxID=1491 RepID=UPI001E472DF0|nr:triple tyrosine motif-containing protein [Clostridium botulinum]MCC5423486.1 triple tyrosine motif-containing protein [Clostridium botulinum]